MTAAPDRLLPSISVDDGVYAPQDDSFLLCAELASNSALAGARVLDMCTGSGIAAIEAARCGAREVFAYDISELAVSCAAKNAEANGAPVSTHVGTLTDAASHGLFDVIVSNPPYVPSPHDPVGSGLHRAWDAGSHGRCVLDLLCTSAVHLLAPDGVVILVQSEFSGIEESISRLRAGGVDAEVVRRRTIEFGPVMLARAAWLEATRRMEKGCRLEELVVIEGRRR